MSKTPPVLKFPDDVNKFPIFDIVYPDTNFILKLMYKDDAKHSAAEALFTHLIYKNNKTKILLSTLVIDEFWGILLRQLFKKDNSRQISYSDLKGDKTVIPKYADKLREHTSRLFSSLLITPISISEELNNDALNNMIHFNLSPRDSYHLAAANSYHANAFISNDTDFESIESETIEAIIRI